MEPILVGSVWQFNDHSNYMFAPHQPFTVTEQTRLDDGQVSLNCVQNSYLSTGIDASKLRGTATCTDPGQGIHYALEQASSLGDIRWVSDKFTLSGFTEAIFIPDIEQALAGFYRVEMDFKGNNGARHPDHRRCRIVCYDPVTKAVSPVALPEGVMTKVESIIHHAINPTDIRLLCSYVLQRVGLDIAFVSSTSSAVNMTAVTDQLGIIANPLCETWFGRKLIGFTSSEDAYLFNLALDKPGDVFTFS